MENFLSKYRHAALFIVLLITFGTWLDKIAQWSECFTPSSISALLILLGTNLASNKISNVWRKSNGSSGSQGGDQAPK